MVYSNRSADEQPSLFGTIAKDVGWTVGTSFATDMTVKGVKHFGKTDMTYANHVANGLDNAFLGASHEIPEGKGAITGAPGSGMAHRIANTLEGADIHAKRVGEALKETGTVWGHSGAAFYDHMWDTSWKAIGKKSLGWGIKGAIFGAAAYLIGHGNSERGHDRTGIG